MGKKKKDERVFILKVTLLDGPMKDSFRKDNKTIFRTVAIRGDQTLEDLHLCLFDAFDRFDEHLYEFQCGTPIFKRLRKGDPDVIRYMHPFSFEHRDDEEEGFDLSKTTIGQMPLEEKTIFHYWFDFGDDWWHKLEVAKIEPLIEPQTTYPYVVARKGESPPQYPDWDEEEK